MRHKLSKFFDLWSKGFLTLIMVALFGGMFFAVVVGVANGVAVLVDLVNRTIYGPAQVAWLASNFLNDARDVMVILLSAIFGPPSLFKLVSAIAKLVPADVRWVGEDERQGSAGPIDYPES